MLLNLETYIIGQIPFFCTHSSNYTIKKTAVLVNVGGKIWGWNNNVSYLVFKSYYIHTNAREYKVCST